MISRDALLTKNFTLGEFFARVMSHERVFDLASWEYLLAQPASYQIMILENLRELAKSLQGLRDHAFGGRPIFINSGYRCPAVNQQAGGADNSQHLLGKAADIEVYRITPKRVQSLLWAWPGGVGMYPGFTHVDIGPKRRW